MCWCRALLWPRQAGPNRSSHQRLPALRHALALALRLHTHEPTHRVTQPPPARPPRPMPQAVIEDQIYPQLQSGFTDGHAFIRELTLKVRRGLAWWWHCRAKGAACLLLPAL